VGRVRPTHSSSRKTPLTKPLLEKPLRKENKRLVILSAVASMHMNLPLSLYYMLRAKNIDVNGIIYGDLEYVYIVKNNALIKIPTKEFQVNNDEI